MMEAAAEVNVYLNATEPWKLAKKDLDRTATVLHTALSAINGIKTGLYPYLPFTSEDIHHWLGQPGTVRGTRAGCAQSSRQTRHSSNRNQCFVDPNWLRRKTIESSGTSSPQTCV